MSTRLEVQSAIEQLPNDEIRNLSKWLQEYLDEECGRQIESNVRSGSGLHDSFEARTLVLTANVDKFASVELAFAAFKKSRLDCYRSDG